MQKVGKYPVINGGVLPSGYVDIFNCNENTITVAQGGSVGFVNFLESKFWLGAHAYSVIPNQDALKKYQYDYDTFNRLMFHVLKNKQYDLQETKVGVGIPSISKDFLDNIKVPLTSKNIQEKIVKILDKLESMQAETKGLLPQEITQRQKQYEYYREKLLAFDTMGGVNSNQYLLFLKAAAKVAGLNLFSTKYKTIGEIGELYGGMTGKSRNDFVDGNAKFITYNNIHANPATDLNTDTKVKIQPGEKHMELKLGDILFTGSSETLDECGLSSVITTTPSEDIYLNSFCFFLRLHDPSLLLPDFSKHLFRSATIRQKIIKTASGVTRNNVSRELFKKIQIPLPCLEIQTKIVKILDKFESLISEAKGLLPKEIAQRQKQFEYYREKLLSFN